MPGKSIDRAAGMPSNWDINEDGQALIEFVRKLITLRHTLPVLRRGRFLTGDHDEALQVSDVKWLNAKCATQRIFDRLEDALTDENAPQ